MSLDVFLYKYYKKKYLKYRNKVLSEEEREFENYKLKYGNDFKCGLGHDFMSSICLGEYCTKDFDKYGCMYLKDLYKKGK